MKPISIEMQKKLVVIPIVNFSCLFIYFYNNLIYKKGSTGFVFLIMIASALPYFLLSGLVASYFPHISTLIELFGFYLTCLVLGICLIKYQEKLDF